MPDWSRESEFLFRSSEVLWARIGQQNAVVERRSRGLGSFGHKALAPYSGEARRVGDHFEACCEVIAREWCALFDEWESSSSDYVFKDGFAVLFFLRILWLHQTVLLRGHRDHRWILESTLARAAGGSNNRMEARSIASEQFLESVRSLDFMREHYGDRLPEEHAQAVLQHYGFPTDLLDCTLNYDVALFFAEGAGERTAPGSLGDIGAIYALPTREVASLGTLVTLPPSVMRPSLQRGVFVTGLSTDDRKRLERYKFCFIQQKMPISSGLGALHSFGPIPMQKYLFPASDPIEELAARFRARR